jgi:hypothetical protein
MKGGIAMILRQSAQSSRLFRLVLVGTLVVVVAFGVLSNSRAFGAGAQPALGQGSLYLTRTDSAIVKPTDFQLGLFQSIVNGLEIPTYILCGSDGRLYVDEWSRDYTHGRILRFNQDGSGRTVVLDQIDLMPELLVFAPNGDLYFGTYISYGQRGGQGIWRIPAALQADKQFSPPQQVLRPSETDVVFFDPGVFLTTGPSQGDLLIAEVLGPEGAPRGKILRAIAPAFASVKEFVPAHTDEQVGNPFLSAGLASNSKGDIFVNDFDNGKILRYGPDGTLQGIFARLTHPNQIAIGPDDSVYVTNPFFGTVEEGGGLFAFDPEGKLMSTTTTAPQHLLGVTVCAPK